MKMSGLNIYTVLKFAIGMSPSGGTRLDLLLRAGQFAPSSVHFYRCLLPHHLEAKCLPASPRSHTKMVRAPGPTVGPQNVRKVSMALTTQFSRV